MELERISVVDVGWPGNVHSLVPEIERLGYHRYWTTEHYSNGQSSSPAVLAGIAAQCSSTIRIGTAGVLLSLAAPLRVVNDFCLLELLHPGRIDLGVAGATGGDVVAEALLGTVERDADHYESRLRELAKLQRLTSWNAGDPRGEIIGPLSRTQPPLWVCGTGEVSARLAGELGAAYAFHDHLRPESTDGAAVLDHYRESFRPSVFRSRPQCLVACTGAIAETPEAATAALESRGIVRSSFCGTPGTVEEQLRAHASAYGVEELAVFVVAPSFDEQLDGYRMIADRIAPDGERPAA